MLFLFQGSNFGSICFMVKFWQQTTGVCTCAYSGTYTLPWEYVHVYFSSIVVHVYLSSWGEPEQAPHTLRTCVYVCLQLYTVHFKWTLQKSSSCTRVIVKGYCQSAASVSRNWDDWSWITHGKLLLVCYTDHQQQVANRQYKFRSWWWLKSLQVRGMHKWQL